MGKRQSGENVRTARRARSDPRVERRGIWPANVRRVARRGARRFEPTFEIRQTPSMSPRVNLIPRRRRGPRNDPHGVMLDERATTSARETCTRRYEETRETFCARTRRGKREESSYHDLRRVEEEDVANLRVFEGVAEEPSRGEEVSRRRRRVGRPGACRHHRRGCLSFDAAKREHPREIHRGEKILRRPRAQDAFERREGVRCGIRAAVRGGGALGEGAEFFLGGAELAQFLEHGFELRGLEEDASTHGHVLEPRGKGRRRRRRGRAAAARVRAAARERIVASAVRVRPARAAPAAAPGTYAPPPVNGSTLAPWYAASSPAFCTMKFTTCSRYPGSSPLFSRKSSAAAYGLSPRLKGSLSVGAPSWMSTSKTKSYSTPAYSFFPPPPPPTPVTSPNRSHDAVAADHAYAAMDPDASSITLVAPSDAPGCANADGGSVLIFDCCSARVARARASSAAVIAASSAAAAPAFALDAFVVHTRATPSAQHEMMSEEPSANAATDHTHPGCRIRAGTRRPPDSTRGSCCPRSQSRRVRPRWPPRRTPARCVPRTRWRSRRRASRAVRCSRATRRGTRPRARRRGREPCPSVRGG